MDAVEEFCHALADSDLFRGRHSTPVATIARALVAYASGHKREAAWLAGVAPSTLCGWVSKLERFGTPRLLETYAHAKRALYSQAFLDAGAEIMQRARGEAMRVPVKAARDARDLAVVGGIMVDKALALRPPELRDEAPRLSFQALILMLERGQDITPLLEAARAQADAAAGSLHHDSER